MSDAIENSEFGVGDVEVIETETLYEGFFKMDRLTLKHRLFDGGWSGPVGRELLYRGVAVGVLLYDPHNDLVGLVEQIRIGAIGAESGPWCMEVVAGIVEPGESLEEVAHRELMEESGVTVNALEYLCQYYPSPGGSDESMHLYCGYTDLSIEGERLHGLKEENEDIRFHILPREQVMEALYQGRFNNAATLIAMQWLALKRADLNPASPT